MKIKTIAMNLKFLPMLNQASFHEDIWESGGTAPSFLLLDGGK
jgi:hypothetical protein